MKWMEARMEMDRHFSRTPTTFFTFVNKASSRGLTEVFICRGFPHYKLSDERISLRTLRTRSCLELETKHHEKWNWWTLLEADHIRSKREPTKPRKWVFRIMGTVGGGGECDEPILTKSGYVAFKCPVLQSAILTPQNNPLLEIDYQARLIRLHEYDKAHPWYGAATLGNSSVYYKSLLWPTIGNFPDDIA